MAFNEEHGEKEVFRNRSEVIAMEKFTDQIGGSSSILPRPGVVHFSDCDPMKLTTDEEGKAKPPKKKSHRYMKRHEKRNSL
ncbi:hypothetical protein FXO37_19368 [Capsicum annuum]|nr:hypothetical protein FXO37_19368 [Capsicum annuum]